MYHLFPLHFFYHTGTMGLVFFATNGTTLYQIGNLAFFLSLSGAKKQGVCSDPTAMGTVMIPAPLNRLSVMGVEGMYKQRGKTVLDS